VVVLAGFHGCREQIHYEVIDMWAYILKRLLLMIPTLLGVITITFVVIQFVPGGPVEQMVSQLQGRNAAGEGAGSSGGAGAYRGRQGVDAKRIEEIKKLYGFDKPAHVRYFQMLGQFMRFDLGKSFFHNKDVWQLILEKLPVSISLGMWTFFLTYLIAVPLGIAKAVRAGTRFDTASTLIVLAGFAIPSFVMGVVLLVLFGGGSFVQWFPLRGLTSTNWADLSLFGKVTDYLWHITLPVTAMVLGGFAVITVMTKNSVLEEIRKHYVLTARAKGLKESTVLWRHVFRNALIPIMTGFPAAFIGAFFSGSLLIETLFSLDGLGLLSYESVIRRDYPVVLGSLFLFTLIGLFTTLIRDLAYLWTDPRVKFE
jgi:microcin C transport system permease protein